MESVVFSEMRGLFDHSSDHRMLLFRQSCAGFREQAEDGAKCPEGKYSLLHVE